MLELNENERMGPHTCPKCGHPQFWEGQHSEKDPCTRYVERLQAECGCTGVRAQRILDKRLPEPCVFVAPDRLREMAEEVTCTCERHQEMKRGLLEMADRVESMKL